MIVYVNSKMSVRAPFCLSLDLSGIVCGNSRHLDLATGYEVVSHEDTLQCLIALKFAISFHPMILLELLN
jgi:hypothetical protein